MWYGSAKEFFYGFMLLKLKDIKKSTVKLQSKTKTNHLLSLVTTEYGNVCATSVIWKEIVV
jgi:hypothetical protein